MRGRPSVKVSVAVTLTLAVSVAMKGALTVA